MEPNDIKQFWDENGYYVARGVFSPAQTERMESDFDRLVTQLTRTGEDTSVRHSWGGSEMDRLDGGASEIVHCGNVHCFSEVWLRALQEEKFLDIVAAILGPDIILHHSKLFQKPAENGSPFPMHQDWPYFPSLQDTMMAAVIHVSDATDAMGCLRVYPGSHKLGRAQQNRGQMSDELIEKYPIEGATVVEAQAGDVVFFHYCTLHGSMPNRSQAIRKTVLVQMLAGTDSIDPTGPFHPNEQLALRGWNHTLTRAGAATV